MCVRVCTCGVCVCMWVVCGERVWVCTYACACMLNGLLYVMGCACHFFAFLSTTTFHYVLPALDCAPVRLWCSIQKNSHLCNSSSLCRKLEWPYYVTLLC